MSPPVEIRPMRPDEREAVLDLLDSAFGTRALFARYMDFDPAFAPADVIVAIEKSRPVSCVQIFTKRVRLAATEIDLGGVGSVATHPDCRGRGLASRVLAETENEMRRRGMPLALLFTGIQRFYRRLGWIPVPMELVCLQRADGAAKPERTTTQRAFTPADLDSVRAIYDADNSERPGTTVRDEAYWLGQLRYAGTPSEDFRVAQSRDRVVAYARGIEFAGFHVMEYASLAGETAAVAALVLAMWPAGRRAFIRNPRPELLRALDRPGISVARHRDPAPMWRVIDPEALAGLSHSTGDEHTLIDELVAEPRVHYWLSDRF